MAEGCKAKNKKGGPCGMTRQQGREWCYIHDPQRVTERRASRRKGGENRAAPKPGTDGLDGVELAHLGGVRDLLGAVVKDTLALANSVQRSRALAYLLGTAIKLHEVGDIAEELAAIRRELGTGTETQG